jgi:[protein-PII] uridylyltransferase
VERGERNRLERTGNARLVPWAVVATATQVRDLLAGTSMPAELVDSLIDGASPLWLLGQPPEQAAADLALCHPALRPGEVRAIAHPLDSGDGHKVAVVAADRPGLMAGTAGALAAHGLTIVSAAASAWPDLGLAVQRVIARPSDPRRPVEWDAVGEDLRTAIADRARLPVRFTPTPPVAVSCTDHEGDRVVVSVRAPDRVGLLWAIASWFEDHGCNIEVANVDADDGTAVDTFVVEGRMDADGLATHLAGRPSPALARPLTAGLSAGLALGRGAARVATAPVRAVLRR